MERKKIWTYTLQCFLQSKWWSLLIARFDGLWRTSVSCAEYRAVITISQWRPWKLVSNMMSMFPKRWWSQHEEDASNTISVPYSSKTSIQSVRQCWTKCRVSMKVVGNWMLLTQREVHVFTVYLVLSFLFFFFFFNSHQSSQRHRSMMCVCLCACVCLRVCLLCTRGPS